jgi:hypothetical protein
MLLLWVLLVVAVLIVAWWRVRASQQTPNKPKKTVRFASDVQDIVGGLSGDARTRRDSASLGRDSASLRRGREAFADLPYGTYKLPHVRIQANVEALEAALALAPDGDLPPRPATLAPVSYEAAEVKALALTALARINAVVKPGDYALVDVDAASKDVHAPTGQLEYSVQFNAYSPSRNEGVKFFVDAVTPRDNIARVRSVRLYSASAVALDAAGLSGQIQVQEPVDVGARFESSLSFDASRDRRIGV